MNLNSLQLSLIDRLVSELEDSISFMETIEGGEEDRIRIQDKVNLLEEVHDSLKFYENQSYLVKFDLDRVDVNIRVDHMNRMELSREEIIEEALGYAQDAGIELEEKNFFEIETLDKTPKNKFKEDVN